MSPTIATRTRERLERTIAPLRGGGRGWALVAVALGWLLILGTRITIPVLLPGIKETFVLDNATAGFVVTVIWGVYGLSQFPAGLLTDRIGDRRMLIVSLVVMTVSVGALGFAPFFGVFLVVAALIGIGNGLFGPTRGTLLSAIYPSNASAAIGVTLAVGSLGAAGLPILAGALVGRIGWRLTIALAAPLLLFNTVLAWRVIPRPETGGGDEEETGSFRGILSAVNSRSVLLGVAGKTVRVFVYQGLTAFLPTYLIVTKGLDELTASAFLSLAFVSGAVAQVVGGRAVSLYGERRVLVSLAVVSMFPILALPFVSNVVVVSVVVTLVGVQLGITPVTNTYIIDALPQENRNGAWGFLRTGYFVVASTGSVFVGILADAGYFDGAFIVMGLLLAVVALIFTFLPGLGEE
jgi:MFS family permease